MLENLSKLKNWDCRAITAENPTGERGKGGMAIPSERSAARKLGQVWKVRPCIDVHAGETVEIANFQGQGAIKHIWMTEMRRIPRTLILRIYWDGCEVPSVEVPLQDFFANTDPRYFSQLSSLAVCVNPDGGYNCYWDMPFYKSFRITVENVDEKDVTLFYQIDFALYELDAGLGYFHAQFRRSNPVPRGEVHTILDGVEGPGQYVGTYIFWGSNAEGWWGEGEVKMYLDGDTDFPTICGTGVEDYFGGAWCYEVKGEYREYTTPYSGLKIHRPDGRMSHSQSRFGQYRWHVSDPVCFQNDLRITVQSLGWGDNGYRRLLDDVTSVAYWYQAKPLTKQYPLPSLENMLLDG